MMAYDAVQWRIAAQDWHDSRGQSTGLIMAFSSRPCAHTSFKLTQTSRSKGDITIDSIRLQ
jgi:hypothetical protein